MAELRGRGIAAGVGLFALVSALVAVLVSSRPPDGPVAVDWDAVPCARCGMLIGDTGFAAQLHLRDGSVRLYDDPGCLLADLPGSASEVHEAWLQHFRDRSWIPLREAAFEKVPHSPMGYGLGAVAAGESEGSLDLDQALERVQQRALAGGAR